MDNKPQNSLSIIGWWGIRKYSVSQPLKSAAIWDVEMYTNYVVGWMQLQSGCLMLLFSLIDAFCMMQKQSPFFSSSQKTSRLHACTTAGAPRCSLHGNKIFTHRHLWGSPHIFQAHKHDVLLLIKERTWSTRYAIYLWRACLSDSTMSSENMDLNQKQRISQ